MIYKAFLLSYCNTLVLPIHIAQAPTPKRPLLEKAPPACASCLVLGGARNSVQACLSKKSLIAIATRARFARTRKQVYKVLAALAFGFHHLRLVLFLKAQMLSSARLFLLLKGVRSSLLTSACSLGYFLHSRTCHAIRAVLFRRLACRSCGLPHVHRPLLLRR